MGFAVAQVRYSFTAQFVAGAAIAARRAEAIERRPKPSPTARTEHRSQVVTAVMQASAAIESELAEVLEHGPGHYLGSNGTDVAAREFLKPLAELIDRQQGVLDRWNTVLHMLRKPPMDRGTQPYQDASLLVGLRNELVHYRSRWNGDVGKKLMGGLQAKGFKSPPFLASGNVNFFPHKLLGAACAHWAAATASAFLDKACEHLGMVSVLAAHRRRGAELARVIPSSVSPRTRTKGKSS